jgi:hypothetical protein
MTSDADMIPLSDYWHPDRDKITTYGHDLTRYKHVPMCYIAMNVASWRKVMNLTDNYYDDLDRDLQNSSALSDIKYGDGGWWGVDQDIITERLSNYPTVKIDRGTESNGYPRGRYDRSAMNDFPSTMIDFHAPHDPQNHIEKIREVIIKAFGECPEL